MATIKVYDIQLRSVNDSKVHVDELLDQMRRIEKHHFPKDEAMNFATELVKRNTELMIIVVRTDEEGPLYKVIVAGYMLHSRVNGVALLHKLCVDDVFQRRGIARSMVTRLKSNLESQGCQRIQLWVDFKRPPAINLYTSLGFRNTDQSRDYYGPGRHGMMMVLDLNYIW